MESLKNILLDSWCRFTATAFVVSGSTIWLITKLYKKNAENSRKRMLETWDQEEYHDVVILHTLKRGKCVPNNSPFAMKLETFLRINNIRYQVDFDLPFGNLGKTPWITLNKNHYTDSQLIINFLTQKYDIKFGSNYSEEQRAIGHTIGIMMDEHLYWGLGLWRYVYSQGEGLSQIFDMPHSALMPFYKAANKRVKIASWYQGVGRHKEEQVIEIMSKNLIALSNILGEKKFILGDEVSLCDCSVFGFLAQFLYNAPGSPYERLLNYHLHNLREYTIRMKDIFWPDWPVASITSITQTDLLTT